MTGTVTRSPAAHDIDWTPVVGAVVWTPPEHRRPTLDQATAMRMLRCTPESFAALRGVGLEPSVTADGPRYDVDDVRNAALYSRSGRTEVETAMGAILSFLRGSDDALFGERRWTYELVPFAPAGDTCLVHPLVPEVFGGESGPLTTTAGRGVVPRADGRVAVGSGEQLSASIVTRGRPGKVVSPAIRSVTEDFLESGVRWHYLSPELKRDSHAAFARGIGNCDTMSAVLADALRAAGFAPRAFRGWIVGIAEVPHSWVEVPDEDGLTKVIDPSLLVLARHSTFGSPDFAERALGATLSRVVPTRCDLAEPIAVATGGEPAEARFSCRSASRAPAPGPRPGAAAS